MNDKPRSGKRVMVCVGLIVAVLGGTLGWLAGCRSTQPPVKVDMSTIRDGVYEGETWKILVGVQVEKGRIAKIEVKKQLAPQKYTDTLKTLIATIIEKQTTEVDDITGATMSCRALKRAVQEALAKAAAPPAGTPDKKQEKPAAP